MKHYVITQFNSRDAVQMFDFLEAQIEALKHRIMDLEAENALLRCDPFAIKNLPFLASA